MTFRHPAYCVLPPYVVEAIARNGTPEQRNWALRTLSLDAAIRSQRVHALIPGRLGVRPGRLAVGSTVEPQRTVYDAAQKETLPGRQVRSEGGPPVADVAVNQAYDGLGATFAFYRDVLGRDSIDDAGLPLLATVHFGQDWDNAQWNGDQMVFGDGDGTLFGSFTASLDVIGHELTHGVTQYEAQLAYLDQSGALNESVSDCFGSMVKQYALRQTSEQADWLIGADLVLPGFHGSALRSMKEPGTAYDDPVLGKDPQPAHMRDYVTTAQDSGGVHINSGIPNRAFALTALALGGSSWERAGAIWYEALRDARIRPHTRFQGFAGATLRAAQHAFGEPSAGAVRTAWGEVGVDV
jgi:Zn-dependent metalloprotease